MSPAFATVFLVSESLVKRVLAVLLVRSIVCEQFE